jgi:hypothetical protein
MNGIHEVTGSIPVRSTNLRSLALPQGASFGWQATRRLSTVARSAKVDGWQATLHAKDVHRRGNLHNAPSPLRLTLQKQRIIHNFVRLSAIDDRRLICSGGRGGQP